MNPASLEKSVLDDELAASVPLAAWLRAALAWPAWDPLGAVLACGHLLRAGALTPRAARKSAAAWVAEAVDEDGASVIAEAVVDLASSIAERLGSFIARDDDALTAWRTAFGAADALAPASVDFVEPRWLVKVAVARDDAESLLVALGVAMSAATNAEREGDSHEVWERRAREALERTDRVALALETELLRVARAEAFTPWLESLGPSQSDLWSSRLVEAGRLGGALKGLSVGASKPGRGGAIVVPRRAVEQAPSLHLGDGEAGNVNELLARDSGPLLALLHEGFVEVYGVSGDHLDGLIVRESDGGIDRIRSVELRPSGPAPTKSLVARCWWVPLAGATAPDLALVVTIERDGAVVEDSLAIATS